MASSTSPPRPSPPTEKPTTARPAAATASYSLFPPIPAPLQRLFDRVPLVTYPSNALPCSAATDDDVQDDDDNNTAARLPTLFVFVDPADAVRGRPSFNPTCLKWQTLLRFAGVPVRLAASNNHASPSGALPFLLPPRTGTDTGSPPPTTTAPRPAQRTTASAPAPAPPPVPAHRLLDYAETHRRHPDSSSSSSSSSPLSLPPADHKPYTALLDTAVRRAWLHAVYLQDAAAAAAAATDPAGSTIAARLYAAAASASPLVRAALARELRTAAASEVYGSDAASAARRSFHEEAAIYRNAEAAFAALAALLAADNDDHHADAYYFFGQPEPTLFDAHVFSYTHLLLEDDDADDNDDNDHSQKRFCWPDRRLPDLVRAQPRLVQHRNQILARYWPTEKAPAQRSADHMGTSTAGNPADSVTWVKV